MQVSSRSVNLLAAALLAVCPIHGWSQPAPEADIVGKYRRAGAASVELEVAARGDGIQAVLTGGGPPAGDGSVPADCLVKAAGHLRGWSLSAVFEPVSTEDFSYSRAQAASERRMLVIAFSPGTAEVEQADTFGYCGLGVSFLGPYHRAN